MQKSVSRSAFTLIELMLVVFLVGIMMAIAMPSFVRSFEGHRMRTAGRTLSAVARYTHSMSLLKQTDLSLVFNLDTGQIDVISTNTALPSFSRAIEGVRLESVQVEGADPQTSGSCVIPYRRSGICKPFVMKLRDQRGRQIMIKVDALSSVKAIEMDGTP